MTYSEIDRCRICGNRNLVPVLDLGDQYLSGVFPSTRDHLDTLTHGPLELVKCHGHREACNLLQLRHTYSLSEMYGKNYGYRSALNLSMVDHLRAKVARLTNIVEIEWGDCVVDIGSNDATLLRAYTQSGVTLIGFDPAGEKFRPYYPSNVKLVSDFFSAGAFRSVAGKRSAKIVTSVAVFYDLPDPMRFMREVHEILAEDGVWLLEQSYMPAMLENRSYDTVCHEHLEYYSLAQIEWMARLVGFRLLDVKTNPINGGSLSVILVKKRSPLRRAYRRWVQRDNDRRSELSTLEPYHAFARDVASSAYELREFLAVAKRVGRLVCGLGASTKGNTILQYCGVAEKDLPFIGEVNDDKLGRFTPGAGIPIIPEDEVLAMRPDYLLVLPWHFRQFFLSSPRYAGMRLVFPLPSLQVIER